MNRLAIIGGRDFNNYELFLETIKEFKMEEIVSGGAKGADTMAEKYARENNIPTNIYLAEWNIYGRKAGIIRNKKIIDNCDKVLAFWDGKSPGTNNSINLAIKNKKPIKIVKYE